MWCLEAVTLDFSCANLLGFLQPSVTRGRPLTVCLTSSLLHSHCFIIVATDPEAGRNIRIFPNSPWFRDHTGLMMLPAWGLYVKTKMLGRVLLSQGPGGKLAPGLTKVVDGTRCCVVIGLKSLSWSQARPLPAQRVYLFSLACALWFLGILSSLSHFLRSSLSKFMVVVCFCLFKIRSIVA